MNTRTHVTAVPALAAALAAKISTPTSALAAGQAEVGPFDDLGPPKLSVVQSPEEYTSIPAELAAGHYLLELSGEPPENAPWISMMLDKLPDGQTLTDLTIPEPGDPSIPEFIWDGDLRRRSRCSVHVRRGIIAMCGDIDSRHLGGA